MKKLWNMHSTR